MSHSLSAVKKYGNFGGLLVCFNWPRAYVNSSSEEASRLSPPDSEVSRTMAELLELLRPSYTDDEQVPAKQMQNGYNVLRARMRGQGRLVLTVHGHPEAVMLPYQDVKLLWDKLTALMEQVENNSFAALAHKRLSNQREKRIPLEQGLAAMREAMLHPSDK